MTAHRYVALLIAIGFSIFGQWLGGGIARADLLVTNSLGFVPGNVLRFDETTGAFKDVLVPNAGAQPLDLALGPDGNLYVTSGLSSPSDDPDMLFAIRRFDPRTGALIDLF